MISSCPPPVPLSDDSMGALLAKVVEQGNTYRECRAAALASEPVPKTDYGFGGLLKRPNH